MDRASISFHREIFLASCIDDNYAMPFTVMARSVMTSLDKGRSVEWFVFNAGVSDENIRKISGSLPYKNLRISWVASPRDVFKGIFPRAHISMAAYQKVLLFGCIPETVSRVLYLDADLLVCRDLSELWETIYEDRILCAVQDQVIPFMDAAKALANFDLVAPFIEAVVGIENYDLMGIDPKAKYFNSGVMIVDLNRWRSEMIEQRIISFLQANKERNRCFDQDGFNAVLWGQWKELDPRWNQLSLFFRYPSWEKSPFDEETFNRIKDDPFIVHFCSYSKPWHWGCRHPYHQKFFDYLDQTLWKGWRPAFFFTMWKMLIFRMRSIFSLIIKIGSASFRAGKLSCFRPFLIKNAKTFRQ